MADVVRIGTGDVLVLAGVTGIDDPDVLDSYQRAAAFLREHAGILCVILAEDEVTLGRMKEEKLEAFRRLFLNGVIPASTFGAGPDDGRV